MAIGKEYHVAPIGAILLVTG